MTDVDRAKWNPKDPWVPWGEHNHSYDEGERRWERGPAMLDYPGWDQVEWRQLDEFEAQLQLISMERGRSAARFWWRDVNTGIFYPMFMKEAMGVITTATIIAGVMQPSRWKTCKRGANYGIMRIGDL